MSDLKISEYLRGVIKGVVPDDNAVSTICVNAGIDDVSSVYADLTVRQQRLALAYLYLWVGFGSTTGSKWSEKDGDWSQSGSDGTYTRSQLLMFLRLARAILSEYDIDIDTSPEWGFRGGGFRNIRSTRSRRHH